MHRPLPGPKPAPLNVVALVYRWGLGRNARTKVNPPLEIEALLGTSRRGAPWPRLAVPFIFGLRFLEILAVFGIPGILAVGLARPTAGAAHRRLPPLSRPVMGTEHSVPAGCSGQGGAVDLG